jgi:hypothetical protein
LVRESFTSPEATKVIIDALEAMGQPPFPDAKAVPHPSSRIGRGNWLALASG